MRGTLSYVVARTLTFRAGAETLSLLERRARQVHVAKTALAERYVVEGLAMDTFPGIVFRDGPAGRRLAVVGGPDVWEIIQMFHTEDEDREAAARGLGLRAGLIDAAIAYYSANRAEVHGWIATNHELMEAARAAQHPAREAGAGR